MTAIREASEEDTATIAQLLGQLGYPARADEVNARLVALRRYPHAVAFVAEQQGDVVGVVTCHSFPSIHVSAPVAWLTTLVVDRHHSGQGIGRQLCGAAEVWARERGAQRISVTSGAQRDDAHAFYGRIGYAQTGVRLTKVLGELNHAT
ncbi:MAG: GNAT family N-acetyltransferase [Gemmatimonadaceae bacterium]